MASPPHQTRSAASVTGDRCSQSTSGGNSASNPGMPYDHGRCVRPPGSWAAPVALHDGACARAPAPQGEARGGRRRGSCSGRGTSSEAGCAAARTSTARAGVLRDGADLRVWLEVVLGAPHRVGALQGTGGRRRPGDGRPERGAHTGATATSTTSWHPLFWPGPRVRRGSCFRVRSSALRDLATSARKACGPLRGSQRCWCRGSPTRTGA